MSKSAQSESLFIDGPAGHLQTLVETPADDERRSGSVAIVCHPHPAHGGAMTNKVAHTLARAMLLCGHVAVRFNFRGVGDSQGSYDEGRGELADALAVVDWAARRYPGVDLIVSGFSFGAAIALQVSLQRTVARLVMIAPPVGRILDASLRIPDALPALIVQGVQDELVDAQAVLDWANEQPPGLRVVEMPQAGHFFHGQLVELRELLVAELTVDGDAAE